MSGKQRTLFDEPEFADSTEEETIKYPFRVVPASDECIDDECPDGWKCFLLRLRKGVWTDEMISTIRSDLFVTPCNVWNAYLDTDITYSATLHVHAPDEWTGEVFQRLSERRK